MLLKFNENAKLFLISYLYFRVNDINEINKSEVETIASCLLRLFVILELGESDYSSSSFKTFLFNTNLKMVDTNHNIDDIQTLFDNHIADSWGDKKDDLKADIIDYTKHSIVFLKEYLADKDNFNFPNNVNVEHIMPISGKTKEVVKTDADINDDAEFNYYVNQVGNKMLLEEKYNKEIGDAWFRVKKSKYKNSNFKIAKEISQYPKDLWTKYDIEIATNKAIDDILKFLFNEK